MKKESPHIQSIAVLAKDSCNGNLASPVEVFANIGTVGEIAEELGLGLVFTLCIIANSYFRINWNITTHSKDGVTIQPIQIVFRIHKNDSMIIIAREKQ